MPKFGKTSRARLASCHPKIQEVANEVIKHWDCTVVEGYRGRPKQDQYFMGGKSKLKFPESFHNRYPSEAIDLMPYHAERPHLHWSDKLENIRFASFVQGVAAAKGIKLIWGGDWDNDFDTEDQQWNDWPHYRLEKL